MLVDLLTTSKELAGKILVEYPSTDIRNCFGKNEETKEYGFFGLDKNTLLKFLADSSEFPYSIYKHKTQNLILSSTGNLQH
jgi:hypothetical protein